MLESDKIFAGSIPENYDRYMVPLIFEPYAADIARRAASFSPNAILETAAGSGVVTRALAPRLPPGASYVVTDLNQPMVDYAASRQPPDTRIKWRQADALALPFDNAAFDLVLPHAVIEHVADAPLYLRECARVIAPGGHCYLSTAPYLSFAGAHLPRLKLQLPLHLMVGRRAAFATFRFLARHAAWTLKEPANENSFIKAARRGQDKEDDLLEKVRVTRLRRQIADAGLRIVREELHATATVRRMPGGLARWLRDSPLTQDALISNMEYVLTRGV